MRGRNARQSLELLVAKHHPCPVAEVPHRRTGEILVSGIDLG
jgi:hypothetical protein